MFANIQMYIAIISNLIGLVIVFIYIDDFVCKDIKNKTQQICYQKNYTKIFIIRLTLNMCVCLKYSIPLKNGFLLLK